MPAGAPESRRTVCRRRSGVAGRSRVVARNHLGDLLRERILGREAVDREQLPALRVRRDVGVRKHCLLPRHDRYRQCGDAATVAPGTAAVGVGVAAGAAGSATAAACGPFIIFSILGPWKATTAASSTHSPIATFFCLAFLAFKGSTRFAIRDSPPLQLVRRPAQVPVSLHSDLLRALRPAQPVRLHWPGRRSRRRTQ